MKTNWQTIKNRVEMKIGEELDINDFVLLANEAVADLNEVAYIIAPTKIYSSNDIFKEDLVYEGIYTERLSQKPNDQLLEINGVYYHEVILPFEYTPGYGELETSSNNEYLHIIEDFNTPNYSTRRVLISKPAFIVPAEGIKMIFRKRIMKINKDDYGRSENVIYVPEDFSSMIKLEVVDKDGNVIKAKETSINSFTENDYDRGLKYTDSIYYIIGKEIHLFSGSDVQEIKLYFTRRMKNVSVFKDDQDKVNLHSLDSQYVELENNFENLLTFSISHKWLENFVGTEDSETNNMFQKYLTLKKEYEEKNLPKRTNKRQSRIAII